MLDIGPRVVPKLPGEEQALAARRETGFGEYMGAMAGEGWWNTLAGQARAQVRQAKGKEADPRRLSRDEWQASAWQREGLDWYEGLTAGQAKVRAEVFDENAYRRWVIGQRDAGVIGMAAGIGAMLVGSLPTPENLIPIGPAYHAAKVARFGLAMRRGAVVGGLAGLAGTAAFAPPVYYSASQFGDDIGWADVMLDLSLGTALGAGLGAGSAAMHHWATRSSRQPTMNTPQTQTALDAMGLAGQDIAAGRPVDVAASPDVRAAIRDAARQEEARAAPTIAEPAVPRLSRASDVAITPRGQEVPVEYAVVPASSLQASQLDDGRVNPNYLKDIQPRDRSRAASQRQIAEMAANLDPRLLGKSPQASQGAPIVGEDGIVESGNGRVLAIRRAYAEKGDSAERYRQNLVEQGYAIDGIEDPVLVRVNKAGMTPEQRAQFAREANERDTLDMGSAERAMADAASLSPETIGLYRGGEIDSAANRPFVRRFLQEVAGANDQAAYVRGDGSMSQQGTRRVQSALLARAYDDADLVAALVEDADNDIKAIGGALTDVAGSWSAMRAEAAGGHIDPSMDQTAALLEATKLVQRARRDGRNVAEFVGQTDMLSGDALSPMGRAFLGLMFHDRKQWTRPVARQKLADALNFYVAEGMKAAPGIDLLGLPPVRPADILGTLEGRTNGPAKQQQPDLLAEPVGGTGAGPRGVGVDAAGPEGLAGAQAGGNALASAGDRAARERASGSEYASRNPADPDLEPLAPLPANDDAALDALDQETFDRFVAELEERGDIPDDIRAELEEAAEFERQAATARETYERAAYCALGG